MAETPFTTRLAQVFAITTAAGVAGSNFGISCFLVPRLLESPQSLLLQQWRGVYHGVKASLPAIGGLGGLMFFYLAYQWKAYLACGVLTVGVGPYTGLVMAKTENQLIKGLAVDKAHQLVGQWGRLNMGKGVLLGAAALLGAWTALE
ncbi:MAG: hypothetical protein M1830_001290 [Pleopsidium flavum]|nr:MAG: hypothetical protein M1830_001290 [Pleopsidium flavum]